MGRYAGMHLYMVLWEAERDGREEPANLAGYDAVIATSEAEAKDGMFSLFAEWYPAADGWEVWVRALPVRDDAVIELGAELAAARRGGGKVASSSASG